MPGGLPHYKNSTASTKYSEPFYPNLFEVSILPPASVSGGEIMLEHVRSISGINNEKGQAAVEQQYKTAKRSYLSSTPDDTIVDLTVNFSLNLDDSNGLYVYKTLRDWNRAGYNPLTGQQGLKKDYVGTLVVVNYNRAGDIFWQRTFHECFITGGLPEIGLDYGSGEPAELSVVFRSDWWDENLV